MYTMVIWSTYVNMGKVSEIFRSIESLAVEFLTRQPYVANLTYLMLPLLWHVLRAHVCRLHRKKCRALTCGSSRKQHPVMPPTNIEPHLEVVFCFLIFQDSTTILYIKVFLAMVRPNT